MTARAAAADALPKVKRGYQSRQDSRPQIEQSEEEEEEEEVQIQQLDLETGRIIATFPSQSAAQRATGVPNQSISKCITNLARHAGGFGWRLVRSSRPIQIAGGGERDNDDKVYGGNDDSDNDDNIAVEQLDVMTRSVVARYLSITAAASATGTSRASLRSCLNRPTRTAGGFQWREAVAPILLCDGCNGEYFLDKTGLAEVPDGDWFCSDTC